jgi:hypothetical protein
LDGGDLHENILTRKNVQGCPPEVRAEIFVKENCVIVHTGKCHEIAQTKRGRYLCTKQIVAEEGVEAVQAFIKRMGNLMIIFTLREYSVILEEIIQDESG